jgi:hypothetical protein
MTNPPIRERLSHLTEASRLLSETRQVLSLAAEAVSAACPADSVLAFTRRPTAAWDHVPR